MKYVCLGGLVLLGGLVGGASAEPIEFEAGEWTYTITMTVPNANTGPIVETESSCMQPWETQLEPTELAKEFTGGAGDACTSSNVTQTANMVSFDMACPGEALSSAKMTMTHQKKGFAMDGDVMIKLGNGTFIEADMKVIANHVGPCSG